MKNMKALKVLLIVIAVVCIGVAVSYPIRYKLELDSNNSELEDLSGMRMRVMEAQHVGRVADEWEPAPAENPLSEESPGETPPPMEGGGETPLPIGDGGAASIPTEASEGTPIPREGPMATAVPGGTRPPADAATPLPTPLVTPPPVEGATATPIPGIEAFMLEDVGVATRTPKPTSTPTPTPSPTPSPTPDRSLRDDADTFKDKAKITLDESRILPELRDIYELNHDLVGWLYIEDTNIDYPVVQSDDGKFYLKHDFYGRSNANGQIILEDKCDPYTPSYNLVLSGHHMNSGAMFGRLGYYKDRDYWETHKIVEFDTLMARKRYVVFAAFYSADYDEHEEGFRYSADIQYKLDADMWLAEIQKNKIYDTGIKAEFGDEFITLTTCDHSRRHDGRFVVVARRIREGESIQ